MDNEERLNTSHSSGPNHRTLHVTGITFIVLVLGLWMQNGVFYSNFNLDEVILFFTSRGYFPSEAPEFIGAFNSFRKTLEVNRNGGSLDPGFFTIILRYWGTLSTKTYWLRALPLGFFFIGLIFLYHSLKKHSPHRLFLPFVPLLVFTNSTLLDYAFTIRPYSMEFAGAAFLFLVVTKNFSSTSHKQKKRNYKSDIFLGLGLAFFLGSRYGLFVPVLLYYLLEKLLFKCLSQRRFLCQILPILFSGATSYFLSYRYQVEFLPILYAKDFFLNNLDNRQLLKLFFGPKTLMLIATILYFILFKRRKWRLNSAPGALYLLYGLHAVIAFFLDIKGMSPIYLYRRYSLILQAELTFLTMIVFLDLMEGWEKVSKFLEMKYDLLRKSQTIFLFFIFSTLIGTRTLSFDFTQRSDIVPILNVLKNRASSEDVVACDQVAYEIIKFMRYYNHYPTDWEKLPKFTPLVFDRMGGVMPSDYYLTILGAAEIYKPDDVVKKSEKVKLIYSGNYQRLYQQL